MEEKNLLKEITFLSKLIGQHKSKLKSCNIASSFASQRATTKVQDGQRSIRTEPYKTPVQNFNSISRYCKVNRTLQGSIPKLEGSRTASVSDMTKNISQQKLLAPLGTSAPHCDKNTSSKELFPKEQKKKVSDSSSSVHMNPNFFTAANTKQEVTTLRCKSVYINPKLLSTVSDNTVGTQCKNEIKNPIQIVSSYHPEDLSLERTPQCSASSQILNESAPVSSLISATKSTALSAPFRTSTTRKKYVYRSKTKLVKATGSTPTGECKMRKCATPVSLQNSLKTIKTPHGGVLLAVSRTKLVRLPGKSRRPSTSKTDCTSTSPTTITKTRYSLRRSATSSATSPTLRIARKVASKYRNVAVGTAQGTSSKYFLDRRLSKSSRKGRQGSFSNQYKVDHRTTISSRASTTRAARVCSHLLISPIRRSSFCNRVWASTTPPMAVQKVAISHKKLLRIGCNPGSRSYLQNSALVRIGGLLYKSSRTKLILSRTTEKSYDTSLKYRTVVKCRSLNAGHIVYVRGNKFVMDQTGKTLKRVVEECATPKISSSSTRKKFKVSRVDIGGVTYIQKTPTVLVRTNTHTARNLVSNAKQRSIAFLAQKMRKINTPCLFYRRFGRCPRQEKGRCELVHDPKFIAICRRFLQGNCTVDGCLLSHDVGPEKMPTCRFFLEGCCVRDLCPYLHVKVNDRAPICRSFLQGYCVDGPECLKRHILLCPEYDKNGSCAKGKYCPYPHSTAPRVQRAICSAPPITSSKEQSEHHPGSPAQSKRKRYYETDSDEHNEDISSSPVSLRRARYYEADSVLDVSQDTQSDVDTSGDDLLQSVSESPANARVRRPKIGNLPSFIALESSELE